MSPLLQLHTAFAGTVNFSPSISVTDLRISGFYRSINICMLQEGAFYGCANDQICKFYSIICLATSGRRGFGPQSTNKEKFKVAKAPAEHGNIASQDLRGNFASKEAKTIMKNSPGLAGVGVGRKPDTASDLDFEKRLKGIQQSALERRKVEERKAYETIDYDAPIVFNQGIMRLGTTVGIGLAIAVFGLVFALGDFLPSGSVDTKEEGIEMKHTKEEKENLKSRLQQYEDVLKTSPNDPDAIQGAVGTLEELGDYDGAMLVLENFIKENPNDSKAYSLLGEIKYELKDYEGSVAAYRTSASASGNTNFEVLRGLTNSLLAARKTEEAVQLLLATRESLNARQLEDGSIQEDGSIKLKSSMLLDPIQVDLLLGKAYSDWGHVNDATSVYDRLISMHPDDFRGYLAKGILLKENGDVGNAERMFIQARFFASENAKALVDRYQRR